MKTAAAFVAALGITAFAADAAERDKGGKKVDTRVLRIPR